MIGVMKDTRGIDHLVIAVRDLEVARQRYAAMGFTLTPVAEHPWGTINSLVQLQGNFLELLAVGNGDNIQEPGPGEFSFGAFNRNFLRTTILISSVRQSCRMDRVSRSHFHWLLLRTRKSLTPVFLPVSSTRQNTSGSPTTSAMQTPRARSRKL